MLLKILRIVLILLEVVAVFNLMIIVHELGHFLAARWRGLVIQEFGIWFGKPLWKRRIGGVDYSLGSLPFGGFVKLPQLAPMDIIEGETDVPREALPQASVLDKMIVAFAGPLFSFLLALFFAVIVWTIGRPVSESEATTTVGYVVPGGPAAEAGFQPGDKILEVDGQRVARFQGMGSDSITWRIVRSEGDTIPVKIQRAGEILTLNPKPQIAETKVWNRKALRQIQIIPAGTPIIGEVAPGTPAAAAGLQPGDGIVAVNGEHIYSIDALGDAIGKGAGQPLRFTIERGEKSFEAPPLVVQAALIREVIKGGPAAAAGLRPGDRVVAFDGQPVASATKLSEAVRSRGSAPATLTVQQKGKTREIQLTPLPVEGQTKPMIGVMWEDDFGITFKDRGRTALVHPRPFEQIRKAATSIFETVGAIASKKSDVKLQHMGGPVMMMRAYYTFFEMDFADGWRLALWFSVVLNVNLALLNMLPIPVLDGGHIVLSIIEGIRRRPVNLKVLETVQSACALLIIGFMVYIFFFDVQDLFSGGREKVKFRTPPAAAESAR